MPSAGGGGGGGGFDYVQDGEPAEAQEGEEWYDTGANEAYVYDGTTWHKMSVVDHAELSGIGSGDHHTRYSDAEAREATLLNSDGFAPGFFGGS